MAKSKGTRNSDYKTIGAISGYFPKQAKVAKKLSIAEAARVATALATAAERGMDPTATTTYVIERMAFDHPSAPWSQIKAEMDKIQGGK